ncbi:MAG: hypothetical protein HGA36_02925 [Candidatus Moranbacteria bacterium]|nr:hypothetical protein [Candidatus Moranbacteria bacterium]
MNNLHLKLKLFFLLAIFLMLPNFAKAAPVVDSISGNISQGQVVTFSGSGFGEKSVAQPLKFENFSGGSNNTRIYPNDSFWEKYGDTGAVYSSTKAHSGSLSFGSHILPGGNDFETNFHTFAAPMNEMFISYWYYIDADSSQGRSVIKLPRISSSEAAGGGGVYNGAGGMTLGGTYDLLTSTGPYCAFNDGNGAELFTATDVARLESPYPSNKTWIRVDMYKKLSTAGIADGVVQVKIYGFNSAVNNAAMTRAAGQTFLLDTVYLAMEDGFESSHNYWMYLDDIYVDNTRARIEICNANTWSAVTKCETQPASVWSFDTGTGASSATVTVSQNSFASGDTGYVYVVDANGQVNNTTPASMIIFGTDSSDITPPSAPTGLGVL